METITLMRRSVTEFPIANALPLPVLVIGPRREILYANPGGRAVLRYRRGDSYQTNPRRPARPSARPCSSWWSRRGAGMPRRQNAMSISPRPSHGERLADVTVTPLPDPAGTLVISPVQERSLAQRMDRQLMARGAVRSMHGMAAVLAHEIKNPLAGIRGAAQLAGRIAATVRTRNDAADLRGKRPHPRPDRPHGSVRRHPRLASARRSTSMKCWTGCARWPIPALPAA